MPRWHATHPARSLLCGLAVAALALWAGSGGGCTVLLDTSANPQKCSNDGDCARFANAACDNAHKICVPKLPYANDAGMMETGGGGTGGTAACELSFDNATRINAFGPDGGLRPLPDPDGGSQ
jgi:hypothetical protein